MLNGSRELIVHLCEGIIDQTQETASHIFHFKFGSCDILLEILLIAFRLPLGYLLPSEQIFEFFLQNLSAH